MKKILITICLLFLLCSYNCLYGAYHNSFDLNGLRWELEADKVEGSKYNNQSNWPTNPSVVFKYTAGTSSQTIIYFNMSLTDYSYINPTGPLVTDIVIPSYVNWDSNGSLGVGTGPLQIIESNAFYNKPVTSVDIPSSILTIKLPCFNNCGNLKSIKIDGKDNFTPSLSSLSNYSTLNGVLFNSDKTQLKRYPAGKNDKLFKVPQTVSKLDDGCFANTKNLAIQFFGAAPEIHENAFVNSTAVVYYPKGAEGWPDFDGGYFDEWGVMAYPIGEQDYVTEDGVILRFHKENSSVIIDNVMYGLGSCTIPSTIGGYPVTSIGDNAFEDCSDGLTSVTIPNSVTSIGERAFLGCSSRTKFIVDSNNPNYKSVNGLLLSKDGKTLIAGINGNVVIPESVTSIGDYAFEFCSGLTSVTIPESVTSIGYSAFYACDGLTSVTIPDSVTSIGMHAFGECSGLTSVTIPNSVTSIGDRAFEGCSGLIKFIVDSNNPNYKSVNGLLLPKDGKTLIAGINGNVVIPDSVTSIGSYAFASLWGLTSVTIPNSVTSIGDSAFYACDGLTSVTIPDSVTSIGEYAFSWCSGLTSITIPDSVTSIGEYAFSWCSGLTSITIPDSVTSIGMHAFVGCNDFLYDTTTIQGVELVDGWVVGYTDECPSVLDLTGVRGIGDGAFWGCSGLTSVTIPNSVTSIGERAFYVCDGLKSVTIPNSVTSIGMHAFVGCNDFLYDTTTIQGVKLVDGWVVGYTDSCPSVLDLTGVRGIGDSAFGFCYGLTSVMIPDNVTSIGRSAFSGCYDLTKFIVDSNNPSYKSVNGLLLSKDGKTLIVGVSGDVVIPDSVTSIGDYAFMGRSGFSSVTIPNSVTSIGDRAFYCCYYLNSAIFLGDAPRNVGDYIFDYCADDFTIKVKKGTKGWNGDYTSTALPATWHGYPIAYDTGSELNLTYNVAFNANGGSGTISAQTMGYDTWTKLRANAFKRTGYTFQGWAKSKTGAVAYKNGVSVKNLASSGTVTLYAIWKPNTYNVAFNANGGKGKMSANSMTYGKAAKLRANAFKRSGYVFIGWAKSKTGAVAYKNAASVKNLRSSGTITLYAVWAKKNYKVAFYANGGKGKMSAQTFTYGKAAKLKKNAFKRSGYTFIGWAKSAALAKKGTVSYKNAQAIKNLTTKGSTIKLYAVWAKTKYKVAFYANGGKGKMSTQTFTYGKAAKLKKNAFKRSGYTFIGWAKSASLAKKGTVSYKNTQAIKNLVKNGKTVKLYAVWKRK